MHTEPDREKRSRCPVCGQAELEPRIRTERYEYEESGAKVTVVAENVPVRVCPACHEIFIGPEGSRIHHDAICRALGLLTPDQIRALRERLGLTQAALAQLTGIGEATISRWERGRLLQNRAMDRYLRLLASSPENPRFLNKLATGTPLPTPPTPTGSESAP